MSYGNQMRLGYTSGGASGGVNVARTTGAYRGGVPSSYRSLRRWHQENVASEDNKEAAEETADDDCLEAGCAVCEETGSEEDCAACEACKEEATDTEESASASALTAAAVLAAVVGVI